MIPAAQQVALIITGLIAGFGWGISEADPGVGKAAPAFVTTSILALLFYGLLWWGGFFG